MTKPRQPQVHQSRLLLATRNLTFFVAKAWFLSVAICGVALAQSALPQGGKVSSGQASIGAPSGSALTITQSSNRAVIDWSNFSIGVGNSVTFVQPSASSATLNRVGGSVTSTIAGQLSSNGQVFLVNPNGIFITPTGSVQAGGGFVASTLAIGNADFSNGYYNFTGNGASAGVSNAGSIVAGQGTYVALLGGTVSSSGTINAYLGRVGLASGEQVILNPTGDGFMQVAVPTGAVAADGRALIDVAGRIKAAGGEIQVSAASAQNASRDVINISGNLAARTVSGSRGNIVLSGGPGGDVTVSGQLSATGGKTQQGGSVAITGSTVNLRGARINASGGTGGGNINVGGGWQGSGSLQRATTTTVDAATTLRADATVTGNGGQVTVWADGTTTFGGFISAHGGPQGGNGGQAEVSGKAHLNLNGDYTRLPLANLKAPLGETGDLLFDPGTVNIVNQTSLNGNTALNGPDTFTAQFISSQLASASVTISTNKATGANGAAGDINLLSNAQIAWSSNSSLKLIAARNITFAAGSSITGNGSAPSLVLQADSAGAGVGTVKFNSGTQVSLPNGTVDLYYNPASNRTVSNGGTNNAAGTVNGTSYTGAPAAETWTSFITAATQRAWMLVNSVFDLQNIANALNGRFVQGKDIDASASSGWNAGAGFVPFGTDGLGTIQNSGNGFNGTFDGNSKSISGLFINRPAAVYAGLFGYIGSAGSVTDMNVANASVTGKGTGPCCEGGVGALAGKSAGSITNSSASGSVTGEWNVGGLVGENTGTVDGSSSTVNVNAIGSYATGGLVGWNTGGGIIRNSYATGTVTSVGSYVGGLVGTNDATIVDSYATGAVSGSDEVGGLVGNHTAGSITRAYATGSVTGNDQIGGLVGSVAAGATVDQTYATGSVTGNTNLGGVAGSNAGTISSSFFDTTTTGQSSAVGVDTGTTTATGLNTGQAFTQASYTGWDFTNTWWMNGSDTRPFLRSEYSTTIANSHQLQMINMSSATLGASYTLRGSIDLSETSGGGSSMWTVSGFVPLGTDGAGTVTNGGNGFTGNFEGAGHSIANLSIIRSSNNTGLFGWTSGGVISDVSVTNATVTGGTNVGALAGVNYSQITNAQSSGTVSGALSVGGLVGNNNNNGVIFDSSSSADVSASNRNVGGLVGAQFFSGKIESSYATGNVNAPAAFRVGGLVGYNNPGSITNSYATGSVNGGQYTGGLVGLNDASSSVSSSYSVGAVSGGPTIGGLIGSNLGSAATSYFDNQTTGQINGVGSGSSSGVTGLSTATFQNGSLPSGFSATAWTAQAGQYPQLSLSAPQTVKITAIDNGSGTSTYGDTPTFSYTVTDTNGVTLCTNNCAAYFSGTPLIDSTVGPTTNAGTSAPGYIARGTVSVVSGYVIQFVNDTISVMRKALTVTASDQSKTYGTNLNLGNSAFTTAGLINSDTVTSVTLTSSGSAASASVAGSPYSIVASSASGSGLSNYTISYVNGVLTVSPAPVTVTALGGSSTYGSSPSNPGLSATGLQNGQSANVLTGLSNSFGIGNTTDAGSYTTNVLGTLTNSNYTLVGTNTGSWTVNPAPVIVTALGGNSIYGSSPSDPGLSATGLKNGQTLSALTGLSNSFGITNTTNAGNYTMSVAGVLTNPNYTVSSTNTNPWTVNPATINVTALGGNSSYGTSPANPGLSATGLQNGETPAVLTGLSNSFGITNTTAAGSYAMNVTGTLTNANYVVNKKFTEPWTVFPAGQAVPPYVPPPTPVQSPSTTGSISSQLQNTEMAARIGGGADGIDGDKGLRLSAPNLTRFNGPAVPTAIAESTAVSPAQDYSLRLPSSEPARGSAAMASADDGDKSDDCGSVSMSASQKRRGGSGGGTGCAAKVADKSDGAINITMNEMTRNAVIDSVEGAFTEMMSAKGSKLTIAKNVTAGTTLVVTAGIIGWLLRGGALLSALLSSMPLWREFDPMVVVSRRREDFEESSSQVDRIFDQSGATAGAA